MRQVWIVLRREYLERVKTKGFILSTVAIPVLMVGLMGLSVFIGVQAERSGPNMALVDLTGDLAEPVTAGMAELGYDIDVIAADVGTEALDARVIEGEIEGYVVLDEVTRADGSFAYRGETSPGRVRSALLESVVGGVVVDLRLQGSGDEAELAALLRGADMAFEVIGDGQAEARRVSGIVAGFTGSLLLYFTLLFYGAYVLRSVIEEKRSRVVEVVISSVSPWRLMLGKVLGVGSMGLTQVSIWLGSAALLVLLGVPLIVANVPAAPLEAITESLPGFGLLGLLLAFFVLGYFLYSSLFAAVGAMCSSEEEAQSAQLPLMILIVVPFLLQMSGIEGRSPPWMDWAAVFPFFSPIMMFPRAVAGSVPWWMVALSLALMALAVVATAWVAGRIYRVGILMQGKRPTLRELVRWVREA